MKRKKILLLCLLLICVMILPSCNKNKKDQEGVDCVIYYVNSEETQLVSKNYKLKAKDTEGQIWELLEALDQEPNSIKKKPVKPENVQVERINLQDNGQLFLYFNEDYSTTLTGVSEVLCRSAIVKMLCQLDEVEYVEFYVGDQPLMFSNDKQVGFERAEDFIDNTGGKANFYQNIDLTLFYGSKNGKSLLERHIGVEYDGTMSMENLIVKYLQNGLSLDTKLSEKEICETVPKSTTLTKTMIKDGVCYLYFDGGFLNKNEDISDEVAIYSIVNSLCEMSTIDKVQFMIDGKQVQTYRENIKFDVPLERNLDLVKGNV